MESAGVDLTVREFINLQFISGLRISDLIKIERRNIDLNLNLHINQSKGSNPKIISLLFSPIFWRDYKIGLHTPIYVYSYSFFYHLYKRFGLVVSNAPGRSNSVTHFARKSLAQNTFNATESVDSVAAALGHRSTNSSLYYLNSDQKKLVLKQGILKAVSKSDKYFKTRNINSRNFIYLNDILK